MCYCNILGWNNWLNILLRICNTLHKEPKHPTIIMRGLFLHQERLQNGAQRGITSARKTAPDDAWYGDSRTSLCKRQTGCVPTNLAIEFGIPRIPCDVIHRKWSTEAIQSVRSMVTPCVLCLKLCFVKPCLYSLLSVPRIVHVQVKIRKYPTTSFWSKPYLDIISWPLFDNFLYQQTYVFRRIVILKFSACTQWF